MTTVQSTSGVTPAQTSSTSTTSTASATTAAAASSATVNYNQFLQLMVAELKNQDPTSPTDPTQFLSQLASFSSVEQQLNTNTKLDSMLTSQALTQADASIGHTVTSSDGATKRTHSSFYSAPFGPSSSAPVLASPPAWRSGWSSPCSRR